jgi:hypothetical protein
MRMRRGAEVGVDVGRGLFQELLTTVAQSFHRNRHLEGLEEQDRAQGLCRGFQEQFGGGWRGRRFAKILRSRCRLDNNTQKTHPTYHYSIGRDRQALQWTNALMPIEGSPPLRSIPRCTLLVLGRLVGGQGCGRFSRAGRFPKFSPFLQESGLWAWGLAVPAS